MSSCVRVVPQPTRRLPALIEWFSSKLAAREVYFVGLIIAIAVAFRAADLDSVPFWVDEAESSINALTILQNGYPTDTYLGLPIYENIPVEHWSESQEYEFRDSSYSKKHFAIYHGWLPLYAIAGSFALHGVRADKVDGQWSIRHDLAEQKRRTRAARLPGVIFGGLFLLIAFIGGKVFYGREAAWAALLIGSFLPWHVMLSREARYYSAQITLTTACCILLWLMMQKCSWKRVWPAAIVFTLLFYTHILSFCTGLLTFALIIPWMLKQNRQALPKILGFGALLAVGTLPWIIGTGFYREQSHIPRALSLLKLPADLALYRPLTEFNFILGSLVVVLVGVVMLLRSRLSARLSDPLLRLAPVLLFLGTWAACGYVCFLLFMPASSFAAGRLNLSYWGPLFLLESAVYAAIARVLVPRASIIAAPALMLLIFLARGNSLTTTGWNSGQHWAANEAIFHQLEAMHLSRNTKMYAAPNDHLIFTFYSGLPVQDITPVRKSYLDSYRGDIVYIEPRFSVETDVLTPERVRQAALIDGTVLSLCQAEQWSMLLTTRDYRENMTKMLGAKVLPQLETLPPFAQQLLSANRRSISDMFFAFEYEFLIRGFEVRTWADWRSILKYRFVNPSAHRGANTNYAERFRGADAAILPQIDTAIYLSHWHPSARPHSAKHSAALTHRSEQRERM